MRLNKDFYIKPATELAPRLIGKLLCRQIDNEIKKYRIIETECYFGQEDTACHANKGRTERTKVMYNEGGAAYVYLCYGIHYMFNIVTGKANHPEAVLIRAIDNAAGPGKLTKLLKINKSLNGEDLCTSNNIWLEDDGVSLDFIQSVRIGINYASKDDKDKLWRYLAK